MHMIAVVLMNKVYFMKVKISQVLPGNLRKICSFEQGNEELVIDHWLYFNRFFMSLRKK